MPRLFPAPEPEISPDDLKVLRAFLVELLATKGVDETVDTVLVLVARLLRDQARLGAKLQALLRGRAEGGTERLGTAQLALWREALQETVAGTDDAGASGGSPEPEEKKKPKRLVLPANLPRRRILVPVEGPLRFCTICGREKSCIGHETSEVLELVPARFEVLAYEREQLACSTHPSDGVVVAPAVVKPLDGGIPGPALLADVVVRKGVDCTPINRLLGIYRRLGVDLPQATVYGWWDQAGEKLRPLAEAIWMLTLGAHLVQVDDTGLRVLDKDTPDGSRRGHMWGMLGDGKWATFRFTETWKGTEMERFLKDRVGWLQGDGYAGYERLYRKTDPAIEVGCWSHARRYFVKAEDGGDKRARQHLVIIGELFAVERDAKNRGLTPDSHLRGSPRHTSPFPAPRGCGRVEDA